MNITLDLPLAVIWAVTLFCAAALGGAIVQRLARDTRRERDAAHAATERSQSATIQSLEAERAALTRRITELETGASDAGRRIAELEGLIKGINENVTGRPAYAELAVFISRGFDALDKAHQAHEERMIERHTALLGAIREVGIDRRRRRTA